MKKQPKPKIMPRTAQDKETITQRNRRIRRRFLIISSIVLVLAAIVWSAYVFLGARVRLACNEEEAGVCTNVRPVLVFVKKTEDECRLLYGDTATLTRRAIRSDSEWVARQEYLGCRGW